MELRNPNASVFAGMLGLLLLISLGCAVEDDKKVAGSTNPTGELLVFRQTATGTADTSLGSIDVTTAGTALSFQIVATPGTSGFDFQNETSSNESQLDNVKLFCDNQLGESRDLPGNPGGPFAAIPAFVALSNHGNELEIVRAVRAIPTLNIQDMAIPAGFNIAALATASSADTRADADVVRLSYDSGRLQAPTGAGRLTFSAVVVDKAGRAAAFTSILLIGQRP